ncbi:MAG: hypothetical protein E7641_06160 [Ruminococcaceae bacterium]|nr:hypothetical protein [Oscillospiraceae bacterium]
MERIAKSKYFLPLCGIIAGLVNGLLGAGGGIIVVFALSLALSETGVEGKDIFANALCVMLPLSAVSALIYAVSGSLTTRGMGVYILPAVLGGLTGALILPRLRPTALKRLFGTLVIYSGILLIIR